MKKAEDEPYVNIRKLKPVKKRIVADQIADVVWMFNPKLLNYFLFYFINE